LIDPHALGVFGTPHLVTSPWLEGCEFTIDTVEGGEARLRVQFYNRVRKASEYDGRVTEFEGAPACQSVRLPSAQLSIAITAFSRDGEPLGLCAITKSATTTVDQVVDSPGGIPYTPNRTAGYSHADHHACDTLDNATLSRYGFEPTGRTPGFANWTCFWDMADDSQVSVFFRLDEVDYGSYYGQPREIAGKEAFQDTSEENSCGFYVVHRSGPTATEMFHVTVEGPLTADQRCNRAADLATTVEEKLSS
jgi:hypothetical protein